MTIRHLLFSILTICLFLSVPLPSLHAADETYQYDPNGRAKRIERSDHSVMEFNYDGVGNLLEVKILHTETAPVVESVTPLAIRRGKSLSFTLTGKRLDGGRVTGPSQSFICTNQVATATRLDFTLTVAADAPQGAQQFTLTTSGGQTDLFITILPGIPELLISPLPLAIPDDGSVRGALVRLSNQDIVDRTITLTIDRPEIVELVETEPITIPAEETEALFHVRGLTSGLARITLSCPELETAVYAVYSTSEYGSISTVNGSVLGVIRESTEDTELSVGPYYSLPLAVVKGGAVEEVVPAAVRVDTLNVLVQVNGQGLDTVSGVSLHPPENVSVQLLDVDPDGEWLTFDLSVSPGATSGYRAVVLDSPVPITATDYYADKLFIADPEPRLDSIDPWYVIKGATRQELIIRGQYLKQATGVTTTPGDRITVGTLKSVNNEGTELRVDITVDATAESGRRLVQVHTPAGPSTDTLSGRNSLEIVSGVTSVHTPIMTRPLGVVKGEANSPGTVATSGFSGVLGIIYGSGATAISPNRGQTGTDVALRISGSGLSSDMTVSLAPAEGVSFGAATASADGTSLDVPLTISPDAQLSRRRLVLTRTDGTEVGFADPAQSVFQITGPLPVIHSLSPHTLKIGDQPVTIRIRGEHLQEVLSVSVEPAHNINIGDIQPAADGRSVDVVIGASAEAAAGSRLLRVETPAGFSQETAGGANSLILYTTSGGYFTPLTADQLGVIKENTSQNIQTIDTLSAGTVGVIVEQDPPPPLSALGLSPLVGVVLGPHAFGVRTDQYLSHGTTTVLTVDGINLEEVDGAAVVPAEDVTLGTPNVSADGSRIVMAITVHNGAEPGIRAIRLIAGETEVPFLPEHRRLIEIGTSPPGVDSISPILADRGETVSLTIRGHNLSPLKRIFAEPESGLIFSSEFTVNDEGTEATTRVHIQSDAPVGARVIRVETAAGFSPDESQAANTFTVY